MRRPLALRTTLALATLLLAAPALAGGPSTRPGVGAIPYADGGGTGTTFRVWAPNAEGVSVIGTFNGWNPAADPLYDEGDGFWSVDRPFAFPGSRYRFAIDEGATTSFRNDARARAVTQSNGDSIVYDGDAFAWKTAGYATPAWHEVVIYEMHLGTFNPGAGPVPGTFDDAIERLDDLVDLGINMIEIMPVNEFAGDVSWGYNPAHPFSVESAYGGPDGFKRFIDAAHARGIGVIVDTVHNHYGPSDLDLWRYDGWSIGPWGGIYFYNDWRASTPWGDTRPDFARPEVRSYIRDNMLLWLDEFRADGLRVDGVQWIRTTGPGGSDIAEGWSLLQWINDEVDATQPWKLIVAEDLAQNEWITKTTGEGGAGFDSQASTFFSPIRAALIAASDGDRNMWSVRDAIASSFNGWHLQRVIYTENHDEVANGHSRVPEEIWPGNAGSWYSRKRSTLGAVLVLCSPGIPMIFQGQEILEDGYFSDVDPVDWSKATTYAGIRALYRDLIRLRRNLDGATRGLTGPSTNVHHVNDGDKMIAFHRWDRGGVGDDVVVMCNFANTSWDDYRIGLPRPGTWHVLANTDATAYSADYGDHGVVQVEADAIPWDGMAWSASMRIAPYSALILSQQAIEPDRPTADLDGDGIVGFTDLVALLAAWGLPGPTDLDGSGTTDFGDLVALLADWGPVG